MRIQSIADNSFRGKYTYGSDNGGKWWTEYRPYSWENYNNSTAEPKRYIDILSSELPNNDQIYNTKYRNNILHKEVITDIMGTVTSVHNLDNDTTRSDILVRGSMGREESVKVFLEKLQKFLDMKLEHKVNYDKQLDKTFNQIRQLSNDFDEHSKDFDSGFFAAVNTKKENKDSMVAVKESIMTKINSIKEQQGRIDKLNDSIHKVRKQIISLQVELNDIAKARQKSRVIDISRRDIEDADRPLLNALKYDFETLINSVVILPHKTITMQKIFAQMNHNKKYNPALKQDIVRYIRYLISFGR